MSQFIKKIILRLENNSPKYLIKYYNSMKYDKNEF
jgi:hypothetical protein